MIMKLRFLVAVAFTALLMVSMFSQQSLAQSYRTDGGAIVVEESLLSVGRKQIVFVVSKNIPGNVNVSYQTYSSEGQVHNYPTLSFPNGLTKGQVIPLWHGDFTAFQATPWLEFSVAIATGTVTYYSRAIVAINYSEQYKEPMIIEVSEVKISGNKYLVTMKGVFYRYEDSVLVINSNIIIPQKAIQYIAPGIMQFTVDEPPHRFAPGKYLLTICQTGHCDTMVGRHRQ